jgi:hypothetical protein
MTGGELSGVDLFHAVKDPLLWGLSACAVLVGLAVRWLDAPGWWKRLTTAAWTAVTVAFIWICYTKTVEAFYYDLDPYCRYNWWWDFVTCGW